VVAPGVVGDLADGEVGGEFVDGGGGGEHAVVALQDVDGGDAEVVGDGDDG
jgi:hypothetical protein